MAIRISRSEVSMKIAELLRQGYKKVSDKEHRNNRTLIMSNKDIIVTIKMSNNGWIKIEETNALQALENIANAIHI